MILSLIVLFIIIYSLYKKVDIFDKFVEGAKESYNIILSLFPSLLGMILASNVFIGSEILNKVFYNVELNYIDIDLIPLMILRPISSSASLGMLTNIFSVHGPDSYLGILASVMQGSTDTTLYILTLYFGSVGIKKTRYALINGLIADLLSFIIAIIIVNLFI